MKILIDENIDVRFKALFPAEVYEVYTIRDMQWNGVKNGALLKLLKEHQFDCWIVVDKNIPYQQNTANLSCLIIVLDVLKNTLKHLTPLMPLVFDALTDSFDKKEIVVIHEKKP